MDEVIKGFQFGIGVFGGFLAIVVILAIIIAIAEEYQEIKRQKHGKGKNGKSKNQKR